MKIQMPKMEKVWKNKKMKKEPLKNKRMGYPNSGRFKSEDIKSAVEWLKEKTKDCSCICKGCNNKLIDKAFEDVCK